MSGDNPIPPPVLWAQRKEDVLLTFSVESKEPIIKIEKDSVYFRGIETKEQKPLEVTIQLYDAVVPENSSFVNKGRCIEMVLRKEKKEAPFWPSLTKDKKKLHYLKVDFNKWIDEGDEEEAVDYNSYSMPNIDGKNEEKLLFDGLESDSDDENLPDLE